MEIGAPATVDPQDSRYCEGNLFGWPGRATRASTTQQWMVMRVGSVSNMASPQLLLRPTGARMSPPRPRAAADRPLALPYLGTMCCGLPQKPDAVEREFQESTVSGLAATPRGGWAIPL